MVVVWYISSSLEGYHVGFFICSLTSSSTVKLRLHFQLWFILHSVPRLLLLTVNNFRWWYLLRSCFDPILTISGILDILSGDLSKGVKIQTKHLQALIELHKITGSFARNVQHLFSDSDLHVLLNTLKAIYLPYETFIQRYVNVKYICMGFWLLLPCDLENDLITSYSRVWYTLVGLLRVLIAKWWMTQRKRIHIEDFKLTGN